MNAHLGNINADANHFGAILLHKAQVSASPTIKIAVRALLALRWRSGTINEPIWTKYGVESPDLG